MHELCYARLANKEYHPDQLYDQEIVMSVTCYHDDEEIADKQERVLYLQMNEVLEEQYGDKKLDLPEMHKKTLQLLSEFFQNAGRSIGQWPNSSAYYAVDIIYDAHEIVFSPEEKESGVRITPLPKLLEVSFLGDWHGVEVTTAEEEIGENGTKKKKKKKKNVLYEQFANDLLFTIATDCDLSSHPRLTRL
jgi:hypothetical protein